MADLYPAVDRDCAFLLTVCMGLRRGEICGLSWGDVDFEAGTLSAEHSVDVFNNLKEPKMKAGTRLLPMPGNVADGLRKLRESQREHIDKLSRDRKKACHYKGAPLELTNENSVIMNVSGRRQNPTTLSKWWCDSRGSFGLEGVTFHELRHTFLTMLVLNGVHPKAMQELAGHSDPQTTMSVYTHVNLDAKRQAVDILAGALTS